MNALTPEEKARALKRLGVPAAKVKAAVRGDAVIVVAQPYGIAGLPPVTLTQVASAVTVRAPRKMNGIETRRSLELEAMRVAGEIRAWVYEGLTLRLAADCRYTPDFLVVENDFRLRLEETKGHWRDDARVKIRVAAEKYPWFTFVALTRRKKKDGGGWAREVFASSLTPTRSEL